MCHTFINDLGLVVRGIKPVIIGLDQNGGDYPRRQGGAPSTCISVMGSHVTGVYTPLGGINTHPSIMYPRYLTEDGYSTGEVRYCGAVP